MSVLPALTADLLIADVPGLSTRLRNALMDCDDYRTVRDVAMASDADLLRQPNVGKQGLRQLRAIIPNWIETPIRAERCERCRFWDGLCHHRSPRGDLKELWPRTKASGWCGDFKERPAAVINPSPPPSDTGGLLDDVGGAIR